MFSGKSVIVDEVLMGEHAGDIHAARKVTGRDLTIEGSGDVEARDVSLKRVVSLASENLPSRTRIAAERRLRLRDSNVTEVESGREPVLVDTTCEHSTKFGTEETWGVCSAD